MIIAVEIRTSTKNDFGGIAGLIIHELGYSDQKPADIISRLRHLENSPNHTTLVATDGDNVVGFIGLCRTITYESGEFLWIQAFAVTEARQRQGIGKRLLAAAADFACQCNISLIKVNCAFHRTKTHQFYEANGFERKSYCFYKYV